MGTWYGEGPRYSVRVFEAGADGYGQTFGGHRAFSNAHTYFEAVMEDRGTTELWLTRLDGADWVFVERLRRDGEGAWVKGP
jgi:hypothetical protein